MSTNTLKRLKEPFVLDVEGLIGSGKCLHPDTPIAMFDGTIKTVKEIGTWDKILGDDNTYRLVLSTCRGVDEMFHIEPSFGDSFIVNKPHILTLKCFHNPEIIVLKKHHGSRDKYVSYIVKYFNKCGIEYKEFHVFCDHRRELRLAKEFRNHHKNLSDVFDVSLSDFLEMPMEWRNNCSLIHAGFEWENNVFLPIKPYNYGYKLGNGNFDTWDSDVEHEKISKIYLKNSKSVRFELLAGLIDSSGFFYNNSYEIVHLSESLVNDVLYLAQSLGFLTTKNVQDTEYCVNNNNFFRVVIFGEKSNLLNLNDYTKSRRNHFTPSYLSDKRLEIKFKVRSLGFGKYNGFTLNGNGRFLLGDFTVTHNTTLIEEGIIPTMMKKGWRVTLIKEPVDNWNEILPRFYKDPKRWGYHFQTKAFHDRVKESKNKWNQYKDHTDVFICERGFLSDTLFMKTLYEFGHVDDLEMKHYREWWSMWEEIVPFRPDMFIYLQPSIEEIMKRVRLRNRDGEEGVSQQYQEVLKLKHDEIFGGEQVEILESHYIPVYHIKTDSDFKNDEKIKNEIVNGIEERILSTYHSRVKE